jgi:hypothetical protein
MLLCDNINVVHLPLLKHDQRVRSGNDRSIPAIGFNQPQRA